MKIACSFAILVALSLCTIAAAADDRADFAGPLRVHPDNPRYLTDDSGRAIYLTGSHTWATVQERGVESVTPDFDYAAFLDLLESHNHNFLRLWTWEHAQWMQFAPREKLIRYTPLPYARTGPGKALDDKPRFDLVQFHQPFFDRLRERVIQAGERGIYVGVMLFQGFSIEQKIRAPIDPALGNAWEGHTMNRRNNINGIDGDPNGDNLGREVHTLAIPEITALQEAYVRKVIETLGDLDHVVWEIANESHAESLAWQEHMTRFIKALEAQRPKQHLVWISMLQPRFDVGKLFAGPADLVSPSIRDWKPDVPVWGPEHGGKVVVMDTDHGAPENHDPAWPWKALLRGHHFIAMDPYRDVRIGSPSVPDPEWSGIRRAMGQTQTFAQRIDLAAMLPSGELTSTRYALADPGKEYLVYQPDDGPFTVDLAAGTYRFEWFEPAAGTSAGAGDMKSTGEGASFRPPFDGPAVLHLKAASLSDSPQ